ncbi:MAG: SMP-30/gluconolactonase/LRE family protein [Alphaproteobacteria bacterium]|jgi:gluconolactonase|nr:SMP-30/gluconolactonase/LRE family protein [Alphaproteobacteria bacterium]
MSTRKGLLALGLMVGLAGCAPSVQSGGDAHHGDWVEINAASAVDPIVQFPHTLSYPEGPLLTEGFLMVSEMGADRVSFIPLDWRVSSARTFAFSLPGCGPTALAPYGEGFVVLCHLSGDLAVVDAEGTEQRRIGAFDGVALRNPNDGASDLHGGVYFSDPGDFYRPRQPVGRVVWLDPQGRLHPVASGLNYPNGVYVVEEDGQRLAYVSEHFSRRVLRYPINEDGSFGPMTVWAVIPEQGAGARFTYDQAGPDGLERAANGAWYVAIYGEGRVVRLDAEGRITGQIETPFQYVTNVAAAPDGLYVVGPFIHDRGPFQGGALFASYGAFGPTP